MPLVQKLNGKVLISGMASWDNSSKKFPCLYDNTDLWNGWHKPQFVTKVFEEICRYLGADFNISELEFEKGLYSFPGYTWSCVPNKCNKVYYMSQKAYSKMPGSSANEHYEYCEIELVDVTMDQFRLP